MAEIAGTPEPPYYAVIFTSLRTEHAGDGYEETAARMFELAAEQPGCLGIESAREGVGLTVSYWRDEEAIAAWKADAEHQLAQKHGRERWYREYALRIARVERAYTVQTGR
jgi:heme-degrading monooxygenase HmoA